MLVKYLHPLSTIHTYDMYVTLFIIEDASAIMGLSSYCDKKIVSFVMTFCIEFQVQTILYSLQLYYRLQETFCM